MERLAEVAWIAQGLLDGGSVARLRTWNPRTEQRIGLSPCACPSWRRPPPVNVVGRELDPEGGKQLKHHRRAQ
jgi:hypothetical protein